MKRNLLTIMLAFLVVFGVNAQDFEAMPQKGKIHKIGKVVKQNNHRNVKSTIMTETFAAGLPAGWQNVDNLTGGTWVFNNPSGRTINTTTNADGFAIFDSDYLGDDQAAENSDLITAPIDCSGNTTVKLSFEHYFYAGYGGAAEVFVSGDNGVTWTSLEAFAASTANAELAEYDISTVAAGQSQVMVKWNWQGNYSWYWAIDDVTVFEPDANDLAVNSVSPAGFVETGSTISPTVTIQNVGASDQTTYSVNLVSTPAGYDETVSNVAITAGQTLVLNSFATWAPADGNYTLTATVTLTGDVNAANNTASSDIEVRPIATGDVVSSFEATSGGQAGIETDGTNIYLPDWSGANIHKYDMDGTFVEDFTITGVSGVRDMAYNPNTGYFYGAAANTSLFEMDFTTKTLVSTITAATDCRAIAYDDDDNTFWANNWATDLTEFDMTGAATTNTMSPVPSIYGAAYDKWSDSANPTMWLFQGTGGDVATQLVEFNMTGAATGRVVDVSAFPGFTETAGNGSGGLATYVDNGVAYFLVNVQQDPNKVYKVYLAKLPSTDATLSNLTVDGTTVTGFDPATYTYAVELPYGTTVVPTVAGVANDANATVTPTQATNLTGSLAERTATVSVLAEDGTTTLDYTVVFTVAANTETDITAFSFAEQTGAATIDATAHTVAIEVVNGTDVTALVSTFTLSAGATANIGGTAQVSGTTPNNFTSAVTYNVVAEDGTTNQDWTVTVTVAAALSDQNDILTYSFTEQTSAATIDATAHTVAIEVATGTDVTALVATFTLSAGATANIGGTAQVSGTTPNDFTSAVTYNVVAQDGTTNQDWTVTVTVAVATAPITFTVTNDNVAYTAFALKGSWDATGNFDATWNGGVEQTPFYNDGTHGDVTASDNIWTVTVNLVPDAGANTWEWGVNDQDGNWLDGNFQFTVNDATPQTLNYNAPVSVNTISNTVNIYPNPSNGAFNVTVEGVYNVEVVDITGKVINTQTVENNATVNINNAGVYFLRFSNNKANFVEKVIVK